jgi:hypothetical protein
MRRALFGELLGRFVSISVQDVSEILEDQSVTGRRFGEIAMAFGLCRPQDVWQAWWEQLRDPPETIDLSTTGIDSQAIKRIRAQVARQFSVIPLRAMESQVVLAVGEDSFPRAIYELPRHVPDQIKFVIADPQDIQRAIDVHYN